MTADNLNEIRKKVRERHPLIHCITNPISLNQCANAILAVGARPIMAEHPAEVEEITSTSGALMLNVGNITDVRMESVRISAITAQRQGIPIILDAVGIACSSLRRRFVFELMEEVTPTVIKGNYSEIKALSDISYRCAGVDSESLDQWDMGKISARLAKGLNSVVLVSGKTDIVSDSGSTVHISNGTPRLGQITGTGCMLGALCACFLSVCADRRAAVTACGVMGISGELAEAAKGSGSFGISLLDSLSSLSDEDIQNKLKMEVIRHEML